MFTKIKQTYLMFINALYDELLLVLAPVFRSTGIHDDYWLSISSLLVSLHWVDSRISLFMAHK